MLPDPVPVHSSESLYMQRISAIWCLVSQTPSQAGPISRSMREGLLSGIGFLSAFLSGAEIGFFRSLFSKRRQSRESCVVHAPPCLWQGRRVSRHELSGTVVSTRLLGTFFIAVRRFLVARSDGCFGSYLGLSTGVPPFSRRAD
jgi:hypothetical protein